MSDSNNPHEEMAMNSEFDQADQDQEGAGELFSEENHDNSAANEAIIARALGGIKNHVKENIGSIAKTSAIGGAVGTTSAILYGAANSIAPEFTNAATGFVLGYPSYRLIVGGFKEAYRAKGMYHNWQSHRNAEQKTEYYRHIRSTERGEGIGKGAWVAIMASTAMFGSVYMESVKDLTIALPHTVTHGVPSFFADNLGQNNTVWDPIWERDDHASCLDKQAAYEDHTCWDGPYADVDLATVEDAAQKQEIISTEYSHYERLLADTWIASAWNKLPDVDLNPFPPADTINETIARWTRTDFSAPSVPATTPAPQ